MSRITSNEVSVENKDMLSVDFETLIEDEVSYELPTPNNLGAGTYNSRIKDIEVFDSSSKITAVDCYHELENSKGEVFYIRFRFFAERGGVKELISVFRKYGFVNFSEAIDIEEVVEIKNKENSSYLAIVSRNKKKKGGSLSEALRKSKGKVATTKVVDDTDDDFEEDYLLDDDDE